MDYSIVIPVYNSSQTLPVLASELDVTLKALNQQYEIIYVDDDSIDESWEVLKNINRQYTLHRIFRLAKNTGQWMATLAGISMCRGKYIITIDDDMEYDTNDILQLIADFHQKNALIVYGIPEEKKNKNIYYRIFFTIRDRFLRLFFQKIKTESFKIFDRNIYLNAQSEMQSFLHFEAYTKFTVSPNRIYYSAVNYRKRLHGKSNYTLFKKIKMIFNYGIEFYKSPLNKILSVILLCCLPLFLLKNLALLPTLQIILLFVVFFLAMLWLVILGRYVAELFFKAKGVPPFIIVESFD